MMPIIGKIVAVCLCVNVLQSSALDISFGTNVISLEDILKVFIPTSKKISNERCRNHSTYYMEQAKNFTLWASEMFDATSKFPNGILVGSTYDMGNFDECVQTKATLNDEEFSGKYCLATLLIESTNNSTQTPTSGLYTDYNVSMWKKIQAISKDRSKRARNEIHWAFCIPSSCTHEDLEVHLRDYTSIYNSMQLEDFKITPYVGRKSCQTQKPLQLDVLDIIFILVIGLFVLIVLGATGYSFFLNPIKSKTGHKVLISFSLIDNLEKLLGNNSDENDLNCINGLKVFSMFLIILGHRIMFAVGSPVVNSDYVESFYSKVEAMVLLNGPIIVDTFFNISGFLACYVLLNKFHKSKSLINFGMLYLHRILRLTPAYAVVLAFYCTLLVKLGSGPLWQERVVTEQERCRASWWTNLLYINNYFYTDKICMFQSWYITCDMHLFLLTPFLVWLLWKKRKTGIMAVTVLIIISVISTFLVAYFKKLDAILLLYMRVLRDPIADNTFRSIYIPTHTRASPYFVGMLTGYLRFEITRRNYKFPKAFVYTAWILAVLIMEVTVYSAYFFYIPGTYDVHASAVYAGFHHFFWSICISWFVLGLSTGNGAWIHPILSWKGLVPLSRITYAAFLCHGAIQLYSVAINRQPIFASIFNLAWYTAGDIALSYVAGLVLCLFFESPIVGIEKLLLNSRKKTEANQNNEGVFTRSDTIVLKQSKLV